MAELLRVAQIPLATGCMIRAGVVESIDRRQLLKCCTYCELRKLIDELKSDDVLEQAQRQIEVLCCVAGFPAKID